MQVPIDQNTKAFLSAQIAYRRIDNIGMLLRRVRRTTKRLKNLEDIHQVRNDLNAIAFDAGQALQMWTNVLLAVEVNDTPV